MYINIQKEKFFNVFNSDQKASRFTYKQHTKYFLLHLVVLQLAVH